FYTASVLVSAVVSLTTILSFIDLMFAIMAIPTILSAIWLSPNVRKATKDYFRKLKTRTAA
ncbi:MAG: alanine:cation symporter family protein, partial [Bacteroidota bacterium]